MTRAPVCHACCGQMQARLHPASVRCLQPAAAALDLPSDPAPAAARSTPLPAHQCCPPWQLCGAASSSAVAQPLPSEELPAAPQARDRQQSQQGLGLSHSKLLALPSLQLASVSPLELPRARVRWQQRQQLQRLCGEAPLPGPRRARRPPAKQRHRPRSWLHTSARGRGGPPGLEPLVACAGLVQEDHAPAPPQ